MTISDRRRHFGTRDAAVREHPTGRTHALDSSHNRLFVGTTTPEQVIETIDVLAGE